MQFVIEAVTGMREDFDTKLTALEARLSDRIRILEDVVRKNSEDIRQLRLEVAGLRRDFERREEPEQLQALEERVYQVEQKVGIVRRS